MLRMRIFLKVFLLSFVSMSVFAQMTEGGVTLYGNEWIDYSKTYYKVKLADDGIYRISYNELIAMGFPIAQVSGNRIKMYSLGKEVPIHTSTSGSLGGNDYIEFIGKRNRGELDKHLYINGETDQLNPEYSLFSDTSAYFLTFDNSSLGQRFGSNTLGINGTSQNHYLYEEIQYFSDKHHKPTYRGEDHIQYSHFDIAEGFGTDLSTTNDITLNVSNMMAVGTFVPQVTVRFGSDDNSHDVQVAFNGSTKVSESYNSFATREHSFPLGYPEVTASNTVSVKGFNSADDNHTVAYAKIVYPKQAQVSTDYLEFVVKASPVNQVFTIGVPGSSYVVFDEENQDRTAVNAFGGAITFGVAPGSDLRKIRLYRTSTHNTISNAKSTQFIDYTQANPTFLILSGDKLYDPSDANNAITAYADYRSSGAGGGHSSYIISADDLIDQFAYGIDRHNIGNRNFAFFIDQHWNNLQYWFNIGKGLEYSDIRKADNTSALIDTKFIVPTYGAPGSDVVMLSEIDKAIPLYSVGRLAATTQQEVWDYLEKMVVHDDKNRWANTFEERYWMKRVLHMSGGRDNDEQIIFFSLENMRSELEAYQYGADVTTIRKYPTEVNTASLSQTSSELINDGVSLITFFGHSAPGVFDLSLEDPSQYTNFEKYPFIISLGCFSGNIHTTSLGISEDFVIEPRKSAIGFLASSGTAYLGAQANSGKALYDLLGDQYYNGSIGDALKRLNEIYENDVTIEIRTLMQQYALHGDPALKITGISQPDLTLDQSSVEIRPEVVDPTLNSFEIEFDVANIGSHTLAPITIQVVHYAPDGSVVSTTPLQLNSPSDILTVVAELPLVDGEEYIGKNTIDIILDSTNAVGERSESNNSLRSLTNNEGYCFYIMDNGVTPLSPGEFGILNSNCPFELKASTNNALLDQQNYIVQIDTTELFNSPIMEQAQINSSGGLISYTPSITKIANTVYYWRVSPVATINNVGPVWSNSSFVYIPSSPQGWSQSHYFQYLQDDLSTLILDEDRRWQFAAQAKDLRFDLGLEPDNGRWLYVDGVPWGSINPTNLGNFISVVVMDPEELIYFANASHPYSELNTSGDYFGFTMSNSASRKKFMDLIDNVPDGSRVFVSTIMMDATANWNTSQWDSDASQFGYDVYDKLEENGILDIGLLRTLGTVPFLVAFEKGGDRIAEEYGQDINDNIEKTYNFYWRLTEGVASTPEIGPVDNWDQIVWRFSEKQSHDNIYLTVYGIDASGAETIVFNNITSSSFNISSLNNSNYEKIRIEIHAEDSFGTGLLDSDRTSPQVDFLRVLFDPLPELALVSDHPSFVYNGDIIYQNEQLGIQIPIENTSTSLMGVTDIQFIVTDPNGNTSVQTQTVGPIPGKSTELVNFSFNPQNNEGDYTWELVLNGSESPEECYYFNNYASREFTVSNTVGSLFVGLENFHVEKKDDTSLLSWNTLSEIDNSHFDVLRSLDGLSFEKIGEVKSNGNSNVLSSYEFTDIEPESGKNYYKLKHISLSGEYGYSETKSLIFDTDLLSFTISPNPTSNDRIRVFGNKDMADLDVALYDNMGKNISFTRSYNNGSHTIILSPIENLPAGYYFLQIKEQATAYIKKIIIVEK